MIEMVNFSLSYDDAQEVLKALYDFTDVLDERSARLMFVHSIIASAADSASRRVFIEHDSVSPETGAPSSESEV